MTETNTIVLPLPDNLRIDVLYRNDLGTPTLVFDVRDEDDAQVGPAIAFYDLDWYRWGDRGWEQIL